MSYSVDTLDDSQIIVTTYAEDFDFESDLSGLIEQTIALFDAGPDRVVYISDSRNIQMSSLDDIIKAANSVRSPDSKQLTGHPKLLKTVTIINNRMAHLAIKGLNSMAFGYLDIPVFESLDDALVYARKLLAEA